MIVWKGRGGAGGLMYIPKNPLNPDKDNKINHLEDYTYLSMK